VRLPIKAPAIIQKGGVPKNPATQTKTEDNHAHNVQKRARVFSNGAAATIAELGGVLGNALVAWGQ